MRLSFTVALSGLVAVAACQTAQTFPPSAVSTVLIDQGAETFARSQAFLHPDRPAEDRVDDEIRKARAVLEFSGVTEGMTIVELEAGGGYYTELMSRVVGPDGLIVMQNPLAMDRFLAGSLDLRLSDDRLANVVLSRTQFDEIELGKSQADLVTWFLGPHELWFEPDWAEGGFGDPEESFAEIARVLKPGGTFVVLDHAAAPGTPASSGGDTHRLDPQIVKDMAQSVGLVLIEESDVLANPNDQYEVNVFDASVRRKTDRFLLKFQKPQ